MLNINFIALWKLPVLLIVMPLCAYLLLSYTAYVFGFWFCCLWLLMFLVYIVLLFSVITVDCLLSCFQTFFFFVTPYSNYMVGQINYYICFIISLIRFTDKHKMKVQNQGRCTLMPISNILTNKQGDIHTDRRNQNVILLDTEKLEGGHLSSFRTSSSDVPGPTENPFSRLCWFDTSNNLICLYK